MVEGRVTHRRARMIHHWKTGRVHLRDFNGKVFMNAELAWLRGDIRIQKAASELRGDYTDGLGSRFKPTYTETWKWALEKEAHYGVQLN